MLNGLMYSSWTMEKLKQKLEPLVDKEMDNM